MSQERHIPEKYTPFGPIFYACDIPQVMAFVLGAGKGLFSVRSNTIVDTTFIKGLRHRDLSQ
jgi:hypothetical protein